jgi:mono/diheme cytochrome c family protein
MFGVKARTVVLMVAAASVSSYGYQAKALRQAKPAAKKAAGKAATPLTPRQQELFKAGSEVYQNVCSVCHQPDGQGKEKLAPSLVGSAFAVGRAEIPIRIVLNGKQGDVGLMPPLAGTLNDEEIAGVLTYIRREWGHTASPVDPDTVKSLRSQTASRTKPWTNDELQTLKGR